MENIKIESKEEYNKIYPVEGLGFELPTKQEAWDKDAPLQLALAFPGKAQDKCNVDCLYCYTQDYHPKQDEQALNMERIENLLEDAKKFGIKNFIIPGYGEPFMNKEFWPTLEKAEKAGMHTLIFSNGTMITEEVTERLKKMPVSLVIKMDSLDHAKQDKLLGKEGFSQKRQRGLELLMKAGFNKPDENGKTRLAVNSVACKETVDDVPKVVEYAIKNNIFPLVENLLFEGGAAKNQDMLGTPEENMIIYQKVIDEIRKISPDGERTMFGEGTCDFETYSIVIEQFSGNAVECFSRRDKNLGNYKGEDSLRHIWENGKNDRKKRISKIDPRSSGYKKECSNCAECPGRKAALEKLIQRT